ncbi:MAG: hypothetical protein NPMRD1_790001 [Nitrosopumilales archaeon]|nr:MAG: hypothetical protein NPMRD1_790001 [Nitrosopumilales archaeon]
MLFSVRITNHQNNSMLNICDSSLLGKKIVDDKVTMNISKSYYYERFVEKEEAQNLLKKCSSINMVGKETISLSVDLGICSQQGIKEINGVPFLLIFKM